MAGPAGGHAGRVIASVAQGSGDLVDLRGLHEQLRVALQHEALVDQLLRGLLDGWTKPARLP
jgi:hypothetical protein